ncbi:hypothetical protein EVAR_10923_1 [Eumeta japonica]|uniref:ATP-dependent DNA helicase PIF1 n=1 Tax=Eumeta variegata TaxID=151549 RepID=A0A4C1U7E2_EUMVA|nr:hypothetical protein EVAR_10923_1 [Eumeta japonica]
MPITPSNYPFEFKIVQFPIKVYFAMTINKAQGQTLKELKSGRVIESRVKTGAEIEKEIEVKTECRAEVRIKSVTGLKTSTFSESGSKA